ncbi:sulfatase family protein [Rhodopirellula sp. P2]|uniref:sulfatase family protein n=1 Tax=Rhodopirellula sp. P2 TaxID=2127060 RepID=UPI002368A75F|nr:sulfatase-like hydrolase/transferase [Rhodopirellula sp. P2]WDQ19490.1 sulfatase-like hydrolase/transferase [Rhodopirellula sp. P2]
MAWVVCMAGMMVTDARSCPAAQPNVVMVLTDDQAPWAFAEAVRSGQFNDVPVPSTPNMDRLAAEGAVFRNFFCTTPVCSPARAALMTGRYASEFGITDFIPQPGHKLYDPDAPIYLDPDTTVTFAEVLQRQGYRTGLIGKWHLGDWRAPEDRDKHPTRHGFDSFMGLTGGGTTPDNPELERDGKVQRFEGLTTDILTDHAIKFVEQNADQPFFLCLSTRAPHGRWLPVAPEDWEPYNTMNPTIPEYPGLDSKRVRKMMKEYLASTTGVDRNLGRLLRTLDDQELTSNTIVIFTSDHGFNMGHNGIWHKGNGIWATKQKPPGKVHQGTRVISDKYRPNLYDHSLRVPAIVRWPGVVKPQAVIEHTASHLDWFPTLCAVAGNAPAAKGLMGRDLTPLLKGESPADWDQGLYTEYDMIRYAVASLRGYRTPRYKLIRDRHNEGRDEFYDLQSDPGEHRNLIREPPSQAAINELDAKLREMEAKVQERG